MLIAKPECGAELEVGRIGLEKLFAVCTRPPNHEGNHRSSGGGCRPTEWPRGEAMREIDYKNALDTEQAKRELMDWALRNTDHPERFIVELAEKLDDVLPRHWATAEETGRQQVKDDPYGHGIGR